MSDENKEKDFVDEMIDERSKDNPAFPELVDAVQNQSAHERHVAELMKDPGFRKEYEEELAKIQAYDEERRAGLESGKYSNDPTADNYVGNGTYKDDE